MRKLFVFILLSFLLLPPITAAQLQDKMVIQRHATFVVTGRCGVGERVCAEVLNATQTVITVSTISHADGTYQLLLPPMQAGGPYDIIVTEGKTIHKYTQILIGDVWLCSGQSNMAFKMRELPVSQTSQTPRPSSLRLFNMDTRFITDSQQWTDAQIDTLERYDYLVNPTWTEPTPEALSNLSAVAYYFGSTLQDSLQVPIGLICNSVGGTGTEAWIDKALLQQHFPAILHDWENNELIQDWVRGRGKQNNPRSDVHPYAPGYMFEAGVRPIIDVPIRGVIWYQGESNAQSIDTHNRLFPLLVKNYRDVWHNDTLPFCFVQLSSIERKEWPAFRDSQRQLSQQIPYCYMAVTSDVGAKYDVHPKQKAPVGFRLALQALSHVYGRRVESDGPEVTDIEYLSEGRVLLKLNHAEGLTTSDAQPPRVFELSRQDGRFFVADAEIQPEGIVLHSDSVSFPINVRYAWQPYTESNVVNKYSLPMSTFLFSISNTKLRPQAPLPAALSAMYSGTLNGKLIVAGGANFPDKPAAEGGAKRYYDDIYEGTITGDDVQWRHVGSLPSPSAYGQSIQADDCIYFLGGENESGKHQDILKLEYVDNEYKLTPSSNPSNPSNSSTIPSRHQVTTAILGSKIYYFGGAQLNGKDSEVFADAWSYDTQTQAWTRLTTPTTAENESITFLGGTAIPVSAEEIMVAGGVNKNVFLRAVRGEYGENYLRHTPDWYQFNRDALIYNTRTDQWRIISHDERTARAGAVLINPSLNSLRPAVYLVGGETKPGIRTDATIKIFDYDF